MPGFDRTGPKGQGPHTGRVRGKCNETSREQDDDSGRFYGRGGGQGRGLGLFRRNRNGRNRDE